MATYTLSREHLRNIAQKRALTVSVLARKSGLPLKELEAYWENETSDIASRTLEKLAKALAVDPGELILLPADKFVSEKGDIAFIKKPKPPKKGTP